MLLAAELPSAPAVHSDASELLPVYGARSCATSGCHGGADEKSRQFVLWSQHDVHSRAYATLTTARAARMAEALQIPDATTSARCTSCHAPGQTVAPALRAPDAPVAEGVSCVSCHGPAAAWMRSHTRSDLTHSERVAGGMRDLRSLYHRANACVACHQNLEPEIVAVGRHPVLTFELDGQAHSQPKHWREPDGHSGAQAWFVGMAVALRERSWALARGRAEVGDEGQRWQAQLWLIRHACPPEESRALAGLANEPVAANFARALEVCDGLAQRTARDWPAAATGRALKRLAGAHREFGDPGLAARAQAFRAELLVVALDRLLAATPAGERPREASAGLDRLFRLVQSQPDFAPRAFAVELARFAGLFEP
jgi:hypothetical protein